MVLKKHAFRYLAMLVMLYLKKTGNEICCLFIANLYNEKR